MKRFACVILLLIAFGRLSAQSNKPKAVLNHLAIYVVNLEKTTNFYSNVFQLDTIPEPFHDGKHAWYSIAPGVALHVIAGSENPKNIFSITICASVLLLLMLLYKR
jgi:lactoylglutathione lyase